MKFDSIEQIIREFNLEYTSLENLKKDLKSKLVECHPDKNGGSFKNNEEKEKYESLNLAYEFVSNQRTDIVSRDEISALTKAIKDLAIDKSETKSEEVLLDKINSSIKTYNSIHLFPKITTTAVTGIISFLWLFPKTISEHEILSTIINTSSKGFTFFWIGSLIITGYIWLILKYFERRDASIKRTLNLESTQNMLFNEFIRHQLYDEKVIDKGFLQFRKEDLIEFISGFDLRRREYHYKKRRITSPLEMFMGSRNIDVELNQSLTDLIINKSVSKGLISVDSTKSLSDIYTLKIDEESRNHYRQHFV